MPTDPAKWEMIDNAMANFLRRLTPVERLAIANDLFLMARRALRAQAENDHPHWAAEQVSGEVPRQISQGVVPHGCDLADWLNLHASEYGAGQWTADPLPHRQ